MIGRVTRRRSKPCGVVLGCALAITSACGGDGSPVRPGPTAPPLPTLEFEAAPVVSYRLSASGAATFRVETDVTIRETAGVGGRIEQIGTVISNTSTVQGVTAIFSISLSMPVTRDFQPRGSLTAAQVDEFGSGGEMRSATVMYTASGVDTQGRPFRAASRAYSLDLLAAMAR